MNRCNKPTPYHVFFLSHHTSSCWPHCTETCTNLYHEDQMLLLAGLHLLHLHVHVITTTTHLCTGRGGAMMGRTARPLDAAPCNCLRVHVTTNTAHILGVTDQSAGRRGHAASARILFSRDIMEQRQHHCNITATAKQRLLAHSHFIIV